MVKLFTHTDLDGVGCAILAKIVFGEDVDISYCNYDDVDRQVSDFLNNHDIKAGDLIFITDISVSEKVAERIDKSNMKDCFVLLDHHATALGLNKYSWCSVMIELTLNIKTSGTELFYNWLLTHSYFLGYRYEILNLLYFTNVVRDWDTWRWSTMGETGIICRQINDLFYIYGRDKFIDWATNKLSNCHYFDSCVIGKEEKIILDMFQKEKDDYIKQKSGTMFDAEIYGYTCGIVFADRFISELGNTLCKNHSEIDLIVIIDISRNTVSYRTVKDEINVGEFAKYFGGGGHPKAAGSQIDKDTGLKIAKMIFGGE